MKKIKITILLAVLMSMAGAKAWAYGAEIDGIFYNLKGSEAEVTYEFAGSSNSSSYRGVVNIPSSITYNDKEYTVTSIGNYAFRGCSGLTSVTIPNSVTSIGNYAFYECSGLTSVTIPNSVTSIGDRAFYDCSSLTSVDIPNSVTSIGDRAFAGCSGLASVTIPNSVTKIGNYAFYECSSLSDVSMSDNIDYIGNDAFAETSFWDSQPDGIIYFDDLLYTWKGEMDENTKIEIRDGTEKVLSNAFKDCENISAVVIPNSVTTIGNNAFSGCSGLTSVSFHCKQIYGWFQKNTSIKEIVIGNEVETINEGAFSGCTGLTSVHITDLDAWCKMEFDYSACNPLANAHHLFLNGEEVKDLVIPNSVTSIGNYAFYGCSGLTSVSIPNSVTYIGWWAFSHCTSLEKINMPASLQVLGRYCIAGCTNMNKIIIDDISAWCNVDFETDESWHNSLFEICPHLYKDDNTEITHLVIPEGVERVGALCFENCEGIKSITLPKSIRSIGVDAFSRTGWWEAQSFGDIMYIDHAFIGVKNGWDEASNHYFSKGAINEINIKEGTTVIADASSWDYWSSLELLSIPNTVINIGARAFTGSKIQTLTIPNSVETIDDGAFAFNNIATSLTIGKNVKRIGERAFGDWYEENKLTNIISLIEEPFDIEWPNEWNSNVQVFDDITYTSSTLYVPKGTKNKYEATAGWNKFQNIIELAINPVDNNDDVDYGGGNGEIDSDTNLCGNVVGNIYYSIADANGEYSSTEGCIVVRKPTSDDVVSGIGEEDLFGEALKDAYTGIIFMVQPGSGTITVNAESEGGLTLKVKVGDNPPTEIELGGKMKAKFPYSVDKASYVYVYAGGGSTGAKAVGTTRSSSEDALKIYGIEWTSGTDGISTVSPEADNLFDVYTLMGNKVRSQVTTLKGLPRGVYVVNGRKMVVE